MRQGFLCRSVSSQMASLKLFLVLLRISIAIGAFDPDLRNLESYGIRISGNNDLFAHANSQDRLFIVQLAPYNDTNNRQQCSVPYSDRSHYVYTIGLGSRQNITDGPFFYYAGEVVPTDSTGADRSGKNGTFIAMMINRQPALKPPAGCPYFKPESIAYLSSYDHQEHFVIAVEPLGRFAIGVARDFVFRYQAFPTSNITSKSSRTVWPSNSMFYPCAADASATFTVIAGFEKNSAQSKARATPTIHVLSNDKLIVLSSWRYTPDENSWQSYLTYTGFESWNSQMTMSVNINGKDPRLVLIGMPFLNTIFIFFVVYDGEQSIMVAKSSRPSFVGFGKSVAWMSNTQAAILYTQYSRDYSSFHWSKIYTYTDLNNANLPATPKAIMPSAQQPLPATISSRFVRMIATPTHLAVLDRWGGTMLILSEPPGFYASTDTVKSGLGTMMPALSRSTPCMSGTFKSDVGVHPCTPCPPGSRNPNDATGATECIECADNAFCPLGAVYELDQAAVASVSQAYPYPRSPELTGYEDLLINNMVTLGATSRCRRISPVFWTLILLLIMGLMLIGMASLNLCVNELTRDRWRTIIKSVFLRTDLVVSVSLHHPSPSLHVNIMF